MNKREVVKALAVKLGRTKDDVNTVLDALIEQIGSELKAGNKVAFLGFGTFSVKTRAAYAGKNPVSGEAITVKAKEQVHFKVGSELNALLNPGDAA